MANNSTPKGGKEGTIVPIHDDGSVLSCKYLHQLENSIRARTPIAGAGIVINRTDAGATITVLDMTAVTLTVCNNGQPATLQVLARSLPTNT